MACWTKTRKDGNQDEFVEDMEVIGASAVSLAGVHGGCGDVLVGYMFRNFLFEIKNPERSEKDRQLRDSQVKFQASWKGQYEKVETSAEAMRIMGVPQKTIQQMEQARAAKRALLKQITEAKYAKQ
jgi:hypothetical protein